MFSGPRSFLKRCFYSACALMRSDCFRNKMADRHNSLWSVYSSTAVATTSLLLLAAALLRIKKGGRRKTRCAWVKNWHRTDAGAFHQLMAELRVSDPCSYRKYVRMDVETFEVLLEKTTPYLQKQTTVMRKPISAAEYLAATLRFLATGESYSSLEFQFRISKSTLSNMIPYVCNVIYTVLKDDYLACPQSELEWLNIAKEFQDRWQFPNCLGAGDGKHIRLLCPSNSGSEYYNYKGYYSLVLMAFVGPEYQFLFVDVGCQGSISDGGVFRRTSLWKAMENSIYLPQAKPLPQNPDPVFEDTSDMNIDYFFVCDDAFPLGLHLMKPYSKRHLSEERRIFNYRLSRARRVSENAFGILAARFSVLHTMMRLSPDKATKVVLACCALHNMLLCKSSRSYCPPGSMDYENENGDLITGSWRESGSSNPSNFRSMPKCKERCPKNAEDMRDIICCYVNGPGAIPWQWKALVV